MSADNEKRAGDNVFWNHTQINNRVPAHVREKRNDFFMSPLKLINLTEHSDLCRTTNNGNDEDNEEKKNYETQLLRFNR